MTPQQQQMIRQRNQARVKQILPPGMVGTPEQWSPIRPVLPMTPYAGIQPMRPPPGPYLSPQSPWRRGITQLPSLQPGQVGTPEQWAWNTPQIRETTAAGLPSPVDGDKTPPPVTPPPVTPPPVTPPLGTIPPLIPIPPAPPRPVDQTGDPTSPLPGGIHLPGLPDAGGNLQQLLTLQQLNPPVSPLLTQAQTWAQSLLPVAFGRPPAGQGLTDLLTQQQLGAPVPQNLQALQRMSMQNLNGPFGLTPSEEQLAFERGSGILGQQEELGRQQLLGDLNRRGILQSGITVDQLARFQGAAQLARQNLLSDLLVSNAQNRQAQRLAALGQAAGLAQTGQGWQQQQLQNLMNLASLQQGQQGQQFGQQQAALSQVANLGQVGMAPQQQQFQNLMGLMQNMQAQQGQQFGQQQAIYQQNLDNYLRQVSLQQELNRNARQDWLSALSPMMGLAGFGDAAGALAQAGGLALQARQQALQAALANQDLGSNNAGWGSAIGAILSKIFGGGLPTNFG